MLDRKFYNQYILDRCSYIQLTDANRRFRTAQAVLI